MNTDSYPKRRILKTSFPGFSPRAGRREPWERGWDINALISKIFIYSYTNSKAETNIC